MCLDSGESPLILACQIKTKKQQLVQDMVNLLVKYGADKTISYEHRGKTLTARDWLAKRQYSIEL